MAERIDSNTPDLRVIDSRGLPVRQVAYHRSAPGQTPERRITLVRHDSAARVITHWDARLSEPALRHPAAPASQHLHTSLSGRPLLAESADAGWRLTLHGDAGQAHEHWDTRATHWQHDYDDLLRPVLIRERRTGQPARLAERLAYGDASDTARNRCGRLVRHDDEAGSRRVQGYSVGGMPGTETRHLLVRLDLPDWPEPEAGRDALLEPGEGATTQVRCSPLGEVLEQTDALGNRQQSRFTVAGELACMTLTLADGTTHPLLSDTQHNAAGQIEAQTAGNGVISQADYDPADGRLLRLSASRPGRCALQNLCYAHDRVGNVLRIEDLSQPVSHFANQKVDPVSTFAYDSLYQLIEATGREAVGTMIGPGLPDLTPAPGDTSRLLNYRQQYVYDASGNLLTLKHIGQHAYTRHMAVAPHSNHALPWIDELAPGDPRAGFDANGNLLDLQAGQPLQWNANNQLHGLRQVAREAGPDDTEQYRYGGDGLRVRKVASRQVSGQQQLSEVRYLPGVEIRQQPTETLAVIVVQAGRCAVRCQIELGDKRSGASHLRYSLGDHLDSGILELDDEARIISHEGYYPFGGTAWWAAHSALEARHKVRRYSGKERDASGLYDYGLRYYAPWLMRWINPDPAGDVDGLNRFVFVRNNPLTFHDPLGLNHEVVRFSRGPTSPSPLGNMSNSLERIMLDDRAGAVAEFAYNVAWSTRSYLSNGAGNQLGDILASYYRAAINATLIRGAMGTLGAEPDWRAHAEHALAARGGLCDEFAAVSGYLAAASRDLPSGVPVYVAQTPGHSFNLLGDHRETDALVLDSWAVLPIPHPVSLNAAGEFSLLDLTPRMPGDPSYAISTNRVSELRARHYSRTFDLKPEDVAANMQQGIDSGAFWNMPSVMKNPQSVHYLSGTDLHDASRVPDSLIAAADRSLHLAGEMARRPGMAAHLLRL